MSDFNAKMHQIRFTALPKPLAGFQGPTSKGREGKGRGVEGKRGKGRYKGSLLLREGRGAEREVRGRGRGGKEKGWKGRGKDPLVLAYTPLI